MYLLYGVSLNGSVVSSVSHVNRIELCKKIIIIKNIYKDKN